MDVDNKECETNYYLFKEFFWLTTVAVAIIV